jgi:mannose-6-phosphate isomerase class I
LTQNHWDTEKALEIMTITPPAKTELEVITNNDAYCEECVCSFKEFHSSRLKIKADKIIEFSSIDNYRILFHVAGKLSINSNKTIDIKVEQGSCIFIPAKTDFELKSQTNSTILFCIPHFF